MLAQNLLSIDLKFLDQFPEFHAFRAASRAQSNPEEFSAPELAATQTPLELLETSYAKIRSELTVELLDRIKAESPSLFERVVLDYS